MLPSKPSKIMLALNYCPPTSLTVLLHEEEEEEEEAAEEEVVEALKVDSLPCSADRLKTKRISNPSKLSRRMRTLKVKHRSTIID